MSHTGTSHQWMVLHCTRTSNIPGISKRLSVTEKNTKTRKTHPHHQDSQSSKIVETSTRPLFGETSAVAQLEVEGCLTEPTRPDAKQTPETSGRPKPYFAIMILLQSPNLQNNAFQVAPHQNSNRVYCPFVCNKTSCSFLARRSLPYKERASFSIITNDGRIGSASVRQTTNKQTKRKTTKRRLSRPILSYLFGLIIKALTLVSA